MPSELDGALTKRRSDVEATAATYESTPAASSADASLGRGSHGAVDSQTFESQVSESRPSTSSADASHLAGLVFDARPAGEWLKHLDETPEEDLLAEALVEGLTERGAQPDHAPKVVPPEEANRLQDLAEALAVMQRQWRAQHEELGAAREDLARRESELRSRERAVEEERERQRLIEEAQQNYTKPAWLVDVCGTMNFAVTGNSGVGKSLFINKIRRVRPGADGWAPVGVSETTARPTMYAFGGEPRFRLWDLPGAGTPSFPAESYVRDMGLRYFDKVVIVSAGRFTTTDLTLKSELETHRVPYFMVRTKVDVDVWNNEQDNSADEMATVAEIKRDLNQHAVERPYLVSLRDPDAYDMPALMNDMFPGLRRPLDPSAPSYCPASQAWNEPWALPPMFSPALSGIQGRWQDAYGAQYLVQGRQTHVTLQDGRSSIVPLSEMNDCVWWCERWWVNCLSVKRNRMELRWAPTLPGDTALVWWWRD